MAFLFLALKAMSVTPPGFEVSVARGVQSLPGGLDRFFRFENWLGDGQPLIYVTLIAAAVLFWRGYWVEAACFLLTFLVRLGDVAVKVAVSEPRPSASLINVTFPHDNLSFPSGHVIGVTLVFGLLFVFARKLVGDARAVLVLRIVCAAYVATIGLARIWVGAHWPSDVLGGYLYAELFLVPMLLLVALRRAPAALATAPA
jgi:undecaprenyl-diphosphatase